MKSKKIKRLLATLIIATTVTATLPIINPISVFAAEVTYATVAEANGAGFTFESDGNGGYVITKYTPGSNTTVSIPSKINNCNVTSIGNEAFSGCSGLTSINIPNSVTSIRVRAFWGCSGLTSINIPNSVTSIESAAFNSCSGLTSINISDSVTSIGNYAFFGCSGLTSINIPNSVTSIGGHAFESCRKLTSINISNSVTSIGAEVFQYCSGLTSINIPNSVTSIGFGAFSGCSGLTSINIPNSVTYIGTSAFSGINPNAKIYLGNESLAVALGGTGTTVIPLALTLSSKTSTSAAVSFPVIEEATALKIEKSEDGGSTWTTAVDSLDPMATSANITGLTADTHYKFRLVMNDNFSGSALDVTTEPAPAVNSVSVTPVTSSVVQGNTQQLTATLNVTGGAVQTVYWSSSDASNKVTVDTNGLVSVATDAALGDYTITATSTVDSSKSGTATITVTTADIPPSITQDPSDKTINSGGSASFRVSAVGTGLTYQWRVDTGSGFVNVTDDGTYSGATTDTLTVNNVGTGISGYKYQVVVKGVTGSPVSSSVAKLVVNSPVISSETTTPAAVRIEGTPAVGNTLTAQLLDDSGNHVTTSAAVSYKWYRLNNSNSDFNDEIGTGNTYTLTSADGNKYIGVSAKVDSVSFKAVIGKILNDTSNTNSSGSEIILSKGSLGIAGDGKVTGLASKRKYTVRANGITYYVKADGTLSLKKSDCDYLIGTEITGLTNGTAYYVERYVTRSISSSSSSHNSDINPVSTTNTTGINASNNIGIQTTTASETKWTQDSNGNWFLILADGTKAKGWNLVKGSWYFCETNTGVMLTGWFQDTDSNWYYLYNGSNNALVGAMLTGWQYVDNNWYYFNTSGAMESDTVVDGYTLGSNGALI